MIGLLVTAYQENGLNLDELPSLCILILCAGLVTTADLIPNGVLKPYLQGCPISVLTLTICPFQSGKVLHLRDLNHFLSNFNAR
jgi:hypothetical protein